MTPSKRQLTAATAATGLVLLATGLWTQARLGANLLPHAFCITSSQPLLWLHLVSDALIAFAYLLIPWAMLNVIRKRPDLPLGWVAWLFGAFIVACGATHALEVWTLYEPVYWYSGVLKAFTALVSLGTAWMLYMLTPVVLRMPSSRQMRESNAALQREVATRRGIEAELSRAKSELEVLLGQMTARAQREAAVLDRFFEVAPLGLGVLDGDMRFVRVNAALPRVTHLQPGDYLGRRFEEVPGMPAEAIEAVRGIARDRQPRLGLAVAQPDGPGGAMRHWLKNFFPIELPEGTFLIGCAVEDVTYQRQVEQQLEGAVRTAEEANRAKDEFLAKVSHELRSPLQVALSSSEVLRRIPELPPMAARVTERLAHAVRMQARMINDLLDLSRILSGKMDLVNELLDPAVPLARVLEHWSATARARGVTIDAHEVRHGEAWVQADPARLEQVWNNLLDNAVRFSPEGGRVEVRARTQGAHWCCEVRDHGMGMAPGELQRVFQPFAQGSRQPRSGKGLGLGLAIVHSLVQAFGGRVHARSEGPGHGCSFTIELPTSEPPQLPASTRAPLESFRLDGVRILYVEDEPEVLAAMREGLAQFGARVLTAADHAAALAQLAQHRIDVLVTDLNLGEGPTGLDLMRALRAMPQHAQVQAIAVSAFGRREDVAASTAAGAALHLVKPLDVELVAQAVHRLRRATPG